MGRCFRGREEFAVKVMDIQELRMDCTDDDVAELQREIESLQKLKSAAPHDSIVEFKDSFEEQGFIFIVMEFISGGNLKKLFCHKVLEEECVKFIALQLVDGLAHLRNAQ